VVAQLTSGLWLGQVGKAASIVDRMMLQRHLELAERHVAEGEKHVARQQEIVAGLERMHRESVTLQTARELLQEMQYAQRLHVADRDRLRARWGQQTGLPRTP
jgi:hypothetical protein